VELVDIPEFFLILKSLAFILFWLCVPSQLAFPRADKVASLRRLAPRCCSMAGFVCQLNRKTKKYPDFMQNA